MSKSNRLLALEARALALPPHKVPNVVVDILNKAQRYEDVTDRQHSYVDSLLSKVETGAPTAKVVDLTRIVAMFDTASAQLKRPFVLFATYAKHEDGTTYVAAEFRVSKAPETGKNAGCLYVKENGTYLGKITPDGRFHPVYVQGGTAHAFDALTTFAADPAAAALAYGQATSSCCFCALHLEDPVSVEVGYGPICAKRWGLPHRHTGLGRIVCEEAA